MKLSQRSVAAGLLMLLAFGMGMVKQVSAESKKPTFYIYLAGPEVFLAEPVAAGEEKKAMIEQMNQSHDWPFRLEGLYPLDNEIPDFKPNFATGIRIYQANIAQMDKADFILANMVRFRGPSMDVGTAFEMGYGAGTGKGVFAYYESAPFYGEKESPGNYKQRVIEHFDLAKDASKDADGISIETFGMSDNLMMIGALDASGAEIYPTFEAAIMAIAETLKARGK